MHFAPRPRKCGPGMQLSALTSLPYTGSNASAKPTVERRRLPSYRVIPEPLRSIRLEEIPGVEERFQVSDPFSFPDLSGNWHTIPAGFVTDLCSVPKLLWQIVAPHQLGFTSVVVHDWCCVQTRDPQSGWTMDQADDVFEALMERQMVDPIKATLAIKAVRAFHFAESSVDHVIGAATTRGAIKRAFCAVAPIAVLALIPGGQVAAVAAAGKLAVDMIRRYRASVREIPAVEPLVPWRSACVIAPDQIERRITIREEWPTFEPRNPLQHLPQSQL